MELESTGRKFAGGEQRRVGIGNGTKKDTR